MSCHVLEPLITITKATRGRGYDVTRHRRNCGVALRSMSAPNSGGTTMNQTEFLDRGEEGCQEQYLTITKDHNCMKRRYSHMAKEGAIL